MVVKAKELKRNWNWLVALACIPAVLAAVLPFEGAALPVRIADSMAVFAYAVFLYVLDSIILHGKLQDTHYTTAILHFVKGMTALGLWIAILYTRALWAEPHPDTLERILFSVFVPVGVILTGYMFLKENKGLFVKSHIHDDETQKTLRETQEALAEASKDMGRDPGTSAEYGDKELDI